MINYKKKVTDSISLLLDSLFPDFNICDVEQQQGIEPPRFLIHVYKTDIRQRILKGGRFVTFSIDIIFDPGEDRPELINEVELPLLLALEKIPVEDYHYRADDLHSSYDSSQSLIHFYLDITISLNYFETKDKIEQLIQHTTVEDKNGL